MKLSKQPINSQSDNLFMIAVIAPLAALTSDKSQKKIPHRYQWHNPAKLRALGAWRLRGRRVRYGAPLINAAAPDSVGTGAAGETPKVPPRVVAKLGYERAW
jgi:hypothetical protein